MLKDMKNNTNRYSKASYELEKRFGKYGLKSFLDRQEKNLIKIGTKSFVLKNKEIDKLNLAAGKNVCLQSQINKLCGSFINNYDSENNDKINIIKQILDNDNSKIEKENNVHNESKKDLLHSDYFNHYKNMVKNNRKMIWSPKINLKKLSIEERRYVNHKIII